MDPYLFENFVSVDGDFLKAKFRAFKENIAIFYLNHFIHLYALTRPHTEITLKIKIKIFTINTNVYVIEFNIP